MDQTWTIPKQQIMWSGAEEDKQEQAINKQPNQKQDFKSSDPVSDKACTRAHNNQPLRDDLFWHLPTLQRIRPQSWLRWHCPNLRPDGRVTCGTWWVPPYATLSKKRCLISLDLHVEAQFACFIIVGRCRSKEEIVGENGNLPSPYLRVLLDPTVTMIQLSVSTGSISKKRFGHHKNHHFQTPNGKLKSKRGYVGFQAGTCQQKTKPKTHILGHSPVCYLLDPFGNLKKGTKE